MRSFTKAMCAIVAGGITLAFGTETQLLITGALLVIAGVAFASAEFYKKQQQTQALANHLKEIMEENHRLVSERITEIEEEIALMEKDLLSPHLHHGIPDLPPIRKPEEPMVN